MDNRQLTARVSFGAAALLVSFCGSLWAAEANSPTATLAPRAALAAIVPGQSTKSSVEAAFGQPWRVVQFDDCGMPMPGQADETWEYRERDSNGSYRLHVEFDDAGRTTVAAAISDASGDGPVEAASPTSTSSMSDMGM